MKDYARAQTSRKTNRGHKGRWVLLVIVLIAGAALLIHGLKRNRTKPVVRSVAIAAQPPSRHQPRVINPPATEKFDFYTLLPKATVVTPAPLLAPKSPVVKKMTYVLQIASVSRQKDAKNMRDQLLKMGYQSFVKASPSDDKHWYRVMIGPYQALSLAERDQRQLYKHEHLNSMLMHKAT
jgi:cell division protein FtsN